MFTVNNQTNTEGLNKESIFSSADYFADDAKLHSDLVNQDVTSTKEIPFMDDTDTLSSLMSILPKDTSNVI
jgi:hypothetical protein